MNKNTSIANRLAFGLFSLTLAHDAVAIFAIVNGMFPFSAALFANRVWAIAAMLLLLRYASVYRRNPRWFVLGVLTIMLWAIWGIAMKNSPLAIITDVAQLSIPLLFARIGWWVGCRDKLLTKLYYKYILLNIMYLTIIITPLTIIIRHLDHAALPDMLSVSAYLVAVIVSRRFGNILWAVPLLLIVLFIWSSKTGIILVAIAMIITWIAEPRVLPKARIIGMLILLVPTVILMLPSMRKTKTVMHMSATINAVIHTISNENVPLAAVLRNPFEYLDASTAQRIFEGDRVYDTLSKGYTLYLLGKGAGGTVNLMDTKDSSVVNAHGGRESLHSVRVIHLGLVYVALKGGILAMIAYILTIIAVIIGAILYLPSAIRSKQYITQIIILILLMGSINSLFTFGSVMRMPMLAISMGAMLRKMHDSRKYYNTSDKKVIA